MKQQERPLPNIIICLFMDIIGYASFILPGLGEFSDIIWAPVSGFIFYKMFGGKFGLIGGIFDFIEEALPFTDFIPSFTIAWAIKYFGKKVGVKRTKVLKDIVLFTSYKLYQRPSVR